MEECLLSTKKPLMESILYSNIAKDKRRDNKLRIVLDKLEWQAKNQPGIYLQQLVDHNGESSNTAMLEKMAY